MSLRQLLSYSPYTTLTFASLQQVGLALSHHTLTGLASYLALYHVSYQHACWHLTCYYSATSNVQSVLVIVTLKLELTS